MAYVSIPGQSPSQDGFPITPNNTVSFTTFVTRIYVGATGNVGVQTWNKAQTNTNLVFAGVPAGTTLEVQAQKIFAANTTASSLLGLF